MEPVTDEARIREAVASLSDRLWVMTSHYDDKRAGVVVRSVQGASEEPALVCVASRKGHWIEPIIRDSHVFAICCVTEGQRLARRKFADDQGYDEEHDPFDSFSVKTLATGSPVFATSELAFDCEVVRHFDLEADHELYVGQVMSVYASKCLPDANGEPRVIAPLEAAPDPTSETDSGIADGGPA